MTPLSPNASPGPCYASDRRSLQTGIVNRARLVTERRLLAMRKMTERLPAKDLDRARA